MNVHLPAVTVFFNHLQTAFPEGRLIPENILLILRYLLASSSAQKKRHTALRILPPFQTRRFSLFTLLVAKVKSLRSEKGNSAAQINTFFAEWKSWRAKQLTGTGSITRAIAQSLTGLLKTSEHIYEEGRKEASEMNFERIRVCTKEEWDTRAVFVKERRRKVDEYGAKARAKLAKLNRGEKAINDSERSHVIPPRLVEIATGSKRRHMARTTSV